MTTLMQASNQWATRPDDQRFTCLDELVAFTNRQRAISRQEVIENKMFRAAPGDDAGLLHFENREGEQFNPTHWAFGQACSNVAAPAKYLRTLPSDIAADAFNASLMQRKREHQSFLTRQNGGTTLAAVTGPQYGRIWNAQVASALRDRFGDGVTGDFTVPGEFGKAITVDRRNTTLFASDRDMFVFLADEKNRIEIPGRRSGLTGTMARGFFVWNSEVGASTFGVATFLFDYVCANRIVWGADGYEEIRIRHTSGAPDRWLEEVAPAIEAYANKSTFTITSAIAHARSHRIEQDKVDDFLTRRFTKGETAGIRMAHMADEDRPIETVWDAVVGATAYARGLPHQDARVDIERKAGKLLTMA